MFIRKSVHTAAMAKLAKANVDLEQDAQRERETAGRLIQRNRELQTQLLAARAEAEANKVDAEAVKEGGKDEGATYVLSSLASALHVEDWSIQNGSEEWEGDVWATMFRILVDAGVVEEDYHQVATFAEIAVIRAERDELLPDALKHRERLQRDREYHAARRALPA